MMWLKPLPRFTEQCQQQRLQQVAAQMSPEQESLLLGRGPKNLLFTLEAKGCCIAAGRRRHCPSGETV